MVIAVEALACERILNPVIETDFLIPAQLVENIQDSSPRQALRDLSHMKMDEDISDLNLEDAYHQFAVDGEAAIPFLVWLLENPASPIALPGSINLKGHDCLHLLLNRGITSYDEAFVIGFTMGNSDDVEPHHLSMLKFFARFIYPKPYRFNAAHLKIFDMGMMYGRKVPYRNIHKVLFDQYAKETLGQLRRLFGISWHELKLIWEMETRTYPREV
jgi:hypothetical protein